MQCVQIEYGGWQGERGSGCVGVGESLGENFNNWKFIELRILFVEVIGFGRVLFCGVWWSFMWCV